MTDLSFHHGTRVSESLESPILIRTNQSAVVCLIGTAPDADANEFPLNTPVLLAGSGDYNNKATKLGAAGTLKDAADAVYDQVATYLFIIRVEEGGTTAETIGNLVGDSAALEGVHAMKKCESLFGRKLKPRLVCVPGFTASLAADGINGASVTNGGADYSDQTRIDISGGDGTNAVIEPIITGGVITGYAIIKPGFDFTSAPTLTVVDPTGSGSGATMTATIGTVGNPIVAELPEILRELRAVALVDGPDTTDAEAVTWRQTINSDRIYPIDVRHLVFDTDLDAIVPQPAAPRFAGVQARVDRSQGFWWSLSNKPINGIIGVSRPIRYGDQANYLNENHVNTTINLGEGFITWGNRVATGIDLNKFISVRRTMDFINEAIEEAYLEFVDKPFSLANLKFMIESGNAFMEQLKAEGAILGGKVWMPEDINSDSEMAQGRITLKVDFEPPAPMEDIRFIQHRNITYYADLRERVLEEIRDGALALVA